MFLKQIHHILELKYLKYFIYIQCNELTPLSDRLSKLDSITFDFIHDCLYCDSNLRFTCEQLLDHRYFTDYYDIIIPEIKESFEKDKCDFIIKKNKICPYQHHEREVKSRNGEEKENKENESKEDHPKNILPQFSNEDNKHRKHQRRKEEKRLIALPNILADYKEDDKQYPIKPPSRNNILNLDNGFSVADNVLTRNKYQRLYSLNPIQSSQTQYKYPRSPSRQLKITSKGNLVYFH